MFRRWGHVITGLILILTTFGLTGCGLVDKTVQILVDEEPSQMTPKEQPLELTTPQQIYGTNPDQKTTVPRDSGSPLPVEQVAPESPEQAKNDQQTKVLVLEKAKVVLYFANDQWTGLICQKREVEKVPAMARKALEELLKGPQVGKLVSAIPKGTRLLDLNIKSDGLAIVNFSKELKANHPGGSTSEALTVYSIVNTLCQFPTVKQVQFLIEGQQVETLAGHIELNTPLERNATLVKAE